MNHSTYQYKSGVNVNGLGPIKLHLGYLSWFGVSLGLVQTLGVDFGFCWCLANKNIFFIIKIEG